MKERRRYLTFFADTARTGNTRVRPKDTTLVRSMLDLLG